MRNRPLHDALRDFALEAAALLTDDLRAGAEVEFDVIDEGSPRGPALYRYKPRTEAFLAERWARLRELPACRRAADELGAGASVWLRVNGLRGEQAEPALQEMLARLYEDATSFGFPEERFERVYREVEVTLYRDSVRARVVAPLWGAALEAQRLELGAGLWLERGEAADAPPEAVWGEDGAGEPAVLCVLERDAPADQGITAAEAADRFASVVTVLRLWAPGFVRLGAPGWRRGEGGRWQALALGGGPRPPGDPGLFLRAGEDAGLREFFAALEAAAPSRQVAWALARFEMGCGRARDDEALSDYLLAMRALLDPAGDTGEAGLALRVAALCAETGARKHVQQRMQAAMALERAVMGGGPRTRREQEPPGVLVAEVEGHLRAVLRDVLCGYLDQDLKGVADDILLETPPEPPVEITVRDTRADQPEPDAAEPDAAVAATDLDSSEPDSSEPDSSEPDSSEPDTSELDALDLDAVEEEPPLEGVTPSGEWGWDDPEDYSAPV